MNKFERELSELINSSPTENMPENMPDFILEKFDIHTSKDGTFLPSKIRAQAFMEDFDRLMEKHNAELFVKGYAEITLLPEWDSNGKLQMDYAEIELD